MSHERFSIFREGLVGAAMLGTCSAIGAGASATLRGDSLNAIAGSAAVVGVSASLFTLGKAFFRHGEPLPPAQIKQISRPRLNVFTNVVLWKLASTAIVCISMDLFLKTAVSAAPLVDAIWGTPITLGAFYCLGLLLQYYGKKNTEKNDKKHGIEIQQRVEKMFPEHSDTEMEDNSDRSNQLSSRARF